MTEPDERAKNTSPLEGRSANHFSVAFTAFEFILDFGQSYDRSVDPFIHTRIILTPHSAGTLAEMLREIVRQYVESVGPIPNNEE